MKRWNNLKLELYSLTSKARKIFSRAYEDITLCIFYDVRERFKLLMVDKEENIIYEREITRAEAFRIINTRP
ncbi:hypothetical protein [Adhaeribacter arboris]|nr:hypothetical protein [Adhaeribacter arboris]